MTKFALGVLAVTSLKACEVSGYTVERTGDYATATVAQRIETCVDCSGTGLLRGQRKENGRVYETVSPCPRARMQKRIEWFNQAQVPAVHANSTVEGFRPSGKEQVRAKELVTQFLQTWPSPRGFVIGGPVGTGKTHLLAGALRHLLLERGVRAAYVEISLLYAQIRRGFNEGKSGGEIIQPLSEVDVLAIDELGKGRGSAFELETLDELIARRYNAGRVTLFGTNYSLRPPEEKKTAGYLQPERTMDAVGKESKVLCDRVGERIYSRLCEMCDFVEFPPETTDRRRNAQQLRGRG